MSTTIVKKCDRMRESVARRCESTSTGTEGFWERAI